MCVCVRVCARERARVCVSARARCVLSCVSFVCYMRNLLWFMYGVSLPFYSLTRYDMLTHDALTIRSLHIAACVFLTHYWIRLQVHTRIYKIINSVTTELN